VELVGLIGRDEAAGRLRGEMIAGGMGVEGLVVDPARPTTTKQRIVTTRNQQVARVDFESDEEAAGEIERALVERARRALAHADAVVVSDYLKGAVTRGLVAALVEGARSRRVPVLVDPKIPHIDYYAGATIVTPNRHEAETATHMRIRNDDDARKAAKIFIERARCTGVLITRGEHGMSMVDASGEAHYATVAREVADVTGAGDTVIATLALGLAAGAALPEAAQLANHAAGIVVGRFGPATVSPAELMSEFADPETRG
jgi:D-beta-D-heptose 7-phosphate kinase/D-beta-D-heptose 1-phosphate adenosyltransferase